MTIPSPRRGTKGVLLASNRTWWRIAADFEEQWLRPEIPTKRRNKRAPAAKPIILATGPGQAWTWDITDVYCKWQGVVFKVYSIIDIYSREIVGWRVEDHESKHLATDMFKTAIARHGAPRLVHADSGPSMKSHLLRDMLTSHGVELSFIRPSVSNDNPFSESAFRTMKYRPGYPRIFDDLEAARDYLTGYVNWYNTDHKHSGIALFSPSEVHDGSWQEKWQIRDEAHQKYYELHPGRFRRRPTTPAPAKQVGINHPDTNKPQKIAK